MHFLRHSIARELSLPREYHRRQPPDLAHLFSRPMHISLSMLSAQVGGQEARFTHYRIFHIGGNISPISARIATPLPDCSAQFPPSEDLLRRRSAQPSLTTWPFLPSPLGRQLIRRRRESSLAFTLRGGFGALSLLSGRHHTRSYGCHNDRTPLAIDPDCSDFVGSGSCTRMGGFIPKPRHLSSHFPWPMGFRLPFLLRPPCIFYIK